MLAVFILFQKAWLSLFSMRFGNFLIEWDNFSVNLQSNPSLNDLGPRQGADLLCFFSFHSVLMVIEDEATLFTSLTVA